MEQMQQTDFYASEKQLQDALGPRYELLERVGEGATAVVYKVADFLADREIKAAKFVRLNSDGEDDERLSALREEFRLASVLNHPNLVRYFDLDIPPKSGFAIATMEYVDGLPLGASLQGLDLETKCQLVVQLLRGLQFLHERGFVHGDVKPGNVLCQVSAGHRSVKLLDYHLTFRPEQLTDTAPRGTLRYVAPEALSGDPLTPRSDLYSVGVLFYEVLAGASPFGVSVGGLVAQHLTAPTPSLNLGRKDLSKRLTQVLRRLLGKRPEGRYASAAEAIRGIAEALGAEISAETPETLLGRVRSVPLIGLDTELTMFREFLGSQGKPDPVLRLFVIEGASRSGKTRFLRECEVCAQMLGFTTICPAFGRSRRSLLDGIEGALGGSNLRVITGKKSAEAEENLQGTQGLPSPQLFARLDRAAEGLSRLGAKKRIGLFIDDLQSLGSADLDALSFFMRGLARRGILHCLTLSEDAALREPLLSWLHTWNDQGIVEKVSLRPLDGEARRDLICRMLPRAVPAVLVDALVENCGERPGAIAATLENLVMSRAIRANSEGQVTAAEDVRRHVAKDMRDTVLRLLGCADETSRHALELLAVGNGAIELTMLARAAGIASESLKATLSSGPLAGMISFRSTTNGILCGFERSSLGTVLVRLLEPERLKELHDQLAEALEQSSCRGDRETLSHIIWHRLRGTLPSKGVALALTALPLWARQGLRDDSFDLARLALECATEDDEKVVLAEIAGDMSIARGAAGNAMRYFKEALKCQIGCASARVRCQRKLASAYASDGNYVEARRLLLPMLGPPSSADAASMAEVARVRLELGITYRYESKFDLAQENFQQAATIAAGLADEDLAANALALIGRTHLDAGSLGESCQALIGSLRKFRSLKDTSGTAMVLGILGYAAMLRKKWTRANDFLRRALPPLREQGYLSEAARTLSSMGAVCQKLWASNEARQYYEEALTLYDRLGRRRAVAAVLANLAQVDAYNGRLEPALTSAVEALKVCPADPNLRCQIMLRIANTQLSIGDISAARDMGLRALEVATAGNLQNVMGIARQLLGESESLDGNILLATEHLESAIALSRECRNVEREGICLARLAEVAITRGDLDGALVLAMEACAKLESISTEVVNAVAHSVMGKVLVARGDAENALAHLIGAEKVFLKIRDFEDLLDAALQLGKAYARLGRWRFAAYYLRTALDMVEQVTSQMASERNRSFFLQDVRRQELFEAIQAGKSSLEVAGGVLETRERAT
jgi:tetratricopeptide (TPR) repeat protein/tRNA A-37 threonylcarbamoyl transferase component Bud32